jgi:peroxiredoxin
MRNSQISKREQRGATDAFTRVLVGDFLPRFVLRSIDGGRVCSTDFLGHQLVLAFVGDSVDAGRRLFRRLRRAYPSVRAMDATVVAVVPEIVDVRVTILPDVPVPFPILCDVNGETHRNLGALNWGGEPSPAMFIADRWGRVIYRALGGLGEPLPSTADVIALLSFDALAPNRP